ncbi:MAG: formylglycine-generating enzyme family protein [Armatimonadetes bacterium]|nr:formylglycine-generating enzyme family protein [Armatimonadota bacterium]
MKAQTAMIVAALLAMPAVGLSSTVGEAKLEADAASVFIDQAIVTAVGDGFAYASDTGRASGIRLSGESLPPAGSLVEISGEISTTSGGERVIEVLDFQTLGSSTTNPLLCATEKAGGGDLAFDELTGAGQRGITGGTGVNTVGQLLTVTGRLSAISPDHESIWLDDGSGPAPSGLRVSLPEPMEMELGAWVKATGPCGLYNEGGQWLAVIQAVSVADVVPLVSNIPMVAVSAGPFTMGNSGLGIDDYEGAAREYPAHTVYVPAFWISRTEVTRAQYRSFIEAGGYNNPSLWSPEGWAWKVSNNRGSPDYWSAEQSWEIPPGAFTQSDDYPVVGVTYYEAEAFAKWAGARLPLEAEWEKAARWDGHSRVYPWGDIPNDDLCNNWFDTVTTGFQTSAVGSYLGGTSPVGCVDMAGNVWEWTSSWYTSYPNASRAFDYTGQRRVLKGGSWYGMYGTRCAARFFASPDAGENDVGFRIAR